MQLRRRVLRPRGVVADGKLILYTKWDSCESSRLASLVEARADGIGARLHAWPLPDVPSGAECGGWYEGGWECRGTQLVLEDAARGLAVYLLNGEVHVLRLADGAEANVGAGTFARFTDAGLVYANGATLRLVSFDRLSR